MRTIPPIITFSEQVYRALLILYPAAYRREYGPLMAQVFRDVCRERYGQDGLAGMALWWCATLLDLTLTVIEERRKVNFTMSKAMFSQLAGPFLILGGAFGALAAFSQLQPGDHYSYYGVYQVLLLLIAPSFLFIGLGCLGLALRYSAALGTLRKGLLALSGAASLMMAGGVIAEQIRESLWNIWFATSLVHVIALALFGLLYARSPFLPIFRWLPLQIVAGWVMMMGITGRFSEPFDNLLTFLMVLGIGLGWLAIGLVVHRQRQAAEPVPA
ncbi:MAG: hypothetical protein JNM70_15965 [Anaerolineae bacterium]|nr:hypothetical protein [Anaerolineae bacterium]